MQHLSNDFSQRGIKKEREREKIAAVNPNSPPTSQEISAQKRLKLHFISSFANHVA